MVLLRLWRGELPLAEAFWSWAVVAGLVVNLTTTIVFLGLVAAGQPAAVMAFVYVAPILFNIVAGVGVWRSAARPDADPRWARPARVAAVIGLAVLSAL
jgi:hypothetical protein